MSNENANSTFVLDPEDLLYRLKKYNRALLDSGKFDRLRISETSKSVALDVDGGQKQPVEFYDVYYLESDKILTKVGFITMRMNGKDSSGFIVDSPLSGYSFHTLKGELDEESVEQCLIGLYAELQMILLFKLTDEKVLTNKR